MSNHTPGPWKMPGNSNIVGPGGHLVASFPRGKGDGATIRRDNDMSLATFAGNSYMKHCVDPVTAARDDLLGEALAACKDALDRIESFTKTGWLQSSLNGFFATETLKEKEMHNNTGQLRAVIAKAEGKQ